MATLIIIEGDTNEMRWAAVPDNQQFSYFPKNTDKSLGFGLASKVQWEKFGDDPRNSTTYRDLYEQEKKRVEQLDARCAELQIKINSIRDFAAKG